VAISRGSTNLIQATPSQKANVPTAAWDATSGQILRVKRYAVAHTSPAKKEFISNTPSPYAKCMSEKMADENKT